MRFERIGHWMIASSCMAVLGIVVLLVSSQVTSRQEQTLVLGRSLVQLLAKVPYERLVPGPGERGFLDALREARKDPDFAYATVLDAAGRPMAEVVAEGLSVTPSLVRRERTAWVGDRVLRNASGGRSIHEFLSPILSAGRVIGHVRVAFFAPDLAAVLDDTRFLISLVLPLVLVAPLFYLLIRRERRPLSIVQERVRELLRQESLTHLEVDPGGGGELARLVNRLLQRIERQSKEVDGQSTASLASTKIAAYQRTRIESVLETLPDGVIVLDEAGSVSYANSRVKPLLGIDPVTALGRKPAIWCSDPELLAFLLKFQGGSLLPQERMELSPDADRIVAVLARRLDPPPGGAAVAGTLVLARDITDEVRARASQAEFVDHVAHELKSPLNVLGMYSEAILGKEGQSEDFRIEACNVIQDEVERLSSLITTLLSMARIEGGAVSLQRQRTRTQEFLRDIFETASRVARREDLKFDLDLSEAVSPIHVDKDLLRVAINNLLTNAIKYNRERGRVSLSVREGDDAVSIRVLDTGVGIAEDQQSRIFEKFFRASGAESGPRSGHGLGLALAKQIVELHGGGIAVESIPGEGSQFTIELPKAPAVLSEAEPT